jgi:hypothetical protein
MFKRIKKYIGEKKRSEKKTKLLLMLNESIDLIDKYMNNKELDKYPKQPIREVSEGIAQYAMNYLRYNYYVDDDSFEGQIQTLIERIGILRCNKKFPTYRPYFDTSIVDIKNYQTFDVNDFQ